MHDRSRLKCPIAFIYARWAFPSNRYSHSHSEYTSAGQQRWPDPTVVLSIVHDNNEERAASGARQKRLPPVPLRMQKDSEGFSRCIVAPVWRGCARQAVDALIVAALQIKFA